MNENGSENGKFDGGDDKLKFQGVKGDSKLENFWYYNKWKVIIGAFFAVFIGISIFQLIERESPDIYLLYAGPRYITGTESFRNAFRSVVDDYNGDGEHGVALVTLTCLTDEQIAEREAEAEAESDPIFIDRSANQQNIKSFDAEIFAGESVICLLDPALFERVRDSGGFMPMSEIFTEEELADVETYGRYGIYISSTKFAKYYTALGELPDDTVLCIRRVSTISVFKGKKKYEGLHADHVDAMRRIVLFEYPEGFTPPDESPDA